MNSMTEPITTSGPVLVIGTGLLGGSIGLALSTHGVTVFLRDISPTAVALGTDMGVGQAAITRAPEIVVVATPPDVAANIVVAALNEFPEAYVTDVASAKETIVNRVLEKAGDKASRYCPVHPMAGSENTGVAWANADLFRGRPWVVVPHSATDPEAILRMRNLGVDLGSVTSQMSPADHDRAVATVSHVPQLISSLLAGRLAGAHSEDLNLVGQGLRDTTRIAASDPRLWAAIIAVNSRPIEKILREYADDLDKLIEALGGGEATTSRLVGQVTEVISNGNQGVSRIPGKHGTGARKYGQVTVLIPDEPGSLGRLFADVGKAGINIEDLRMEHSFGQAQGMVILSVVPEAVNDLVQALEEFGWRVVLDVGQ